MPRCSSAGIKKKAVRLILVDVFLWPSICYRRITSDPLVHYGCHFGHTIFAFSNVRTLITNGLSWRVEDAQPESLTPM